MKIKMNRKAQISKSLADFVGYGAFVIVFLVFLLLFNLAVVKEKPAENKLDQIGFGDVTSQYVLLNFLRSDVYLASGNMKMSDYVVLATFEGSDDNYPLIKRQLDSYINSFGGCYEFRTSKDGKKILYISTAKTGCRLPPPISIRIPTSDNEIIEASLRMLIK